jgi:hypothetical protein
MNDPSRAQRLGALERANRVRSARAELKRHIAAGELTAAQVILSCPWETEGMLIAELLVSQRHWGNGRCRGFLAGLGMGETKTIGSMTPRQRIAASAVLTRNHAISRQQDGRSQRRGR